MESFLIAFSHHFWSIWMSFNDYYYPFLSMTQGMNLVFVILLI
jgi:hypothetical protein